MSVLAPKLLQLQREWADCTRCKLSKTRNKLVFGEGNPGAHILVLGEAPGEHEDETGLPFQGEAGSILNGYLESMQIDRDRDLYVTNVVCCRPTVEGKDERTGEPRIENRPPSKIEREACRPRLLETIYLVDPLLIVTIGKVPFQALFGKAPTIASIRGRMHTFHLPGRHTDVRYAVLPMYHTAFLYRTHDNRHEGPWGRTSTDWAKVCSVIDHLREVYYGIPQPQRENEPDDEGGESKSRRTRRGAVSRR